MGRIAGLDNGKEKKKNQLSFGRYRAIIIAIACFLFFDLGVLVLNFYTSFKISEDALAINLSGRQRMLSQRTTKALFMVASEEGILNDLQEAASQPHISDDPVVAKEYAERIEEQKSKIKIAQKELEYSSGIFNETLRAFQNGATIRGTQNDQPVYLQRSQGQESPRILDSAREVWDPYYELIQPVIHDTATLKQIDAAVQYAQKNNLKILGYMNDLTNDLEHLSEGRSRWLRFVQATGIILALLNFLFILFKFIRQLRLSDRAVEIANEETQDILQTVKEGLFLLTPEFTIGMQISMSASDLFGLKLHPGDNFFEMLSARVSAKVLEDAKDYVGLLMSPDVKEQLVQSINPLSEVAIQVTNKLGIEKTHYLLFNFSRVLNEKGDIRHLLVTVQDITKIKGLENQLQEEQRKAQKEFAMILKAIKADPQELRIFVDQAQDSLLQINNMLRSTSEFRNEARLRAIIDQVAREIHTIKGNASALGLDSIAEQAHEFESELNRVKNSNLHGASLGEELLALPIPLGNLLSVITMLKELVDSQFVPTTSSEYTNDTQLATPKINSLKTPSNKFNPLDNTVLNQLASSVAMGENKDVELSISSDDGWEEFSLETAKAIRDIAVQLVRNAIVHGIEMPEKRLATHKTRNGHIDIKLRRHADHRWTLSVSDDGQGIQTMAIRDKLIALGWYTKEQLAKMTTEQIAAQICHPDFSTASGVSIHAGRGAGLDLVRSEINKLRLPDLHISSKLGKYTEFVLTFSS